MDWDKIAVAIIPALFVTIFPGATVVVHEIGDGSIRFLPITYIPEGLGAGRVVHVTHSGPSFEIQVLSSDSPPMLTKIIFGPRA